jgi:hypothetical protein
MFCHYSSIGWSHTAGRGRAVIQQCVSRGVQPTLQYGRSRAERAIVGSVVPYKLIQLSSDRGAAVRVGACMPAGSRPRRAPAAQPPDTVPLYKRKLFISRSCPILVLIYVLGRPRRADVKHELKNYQGPTTSLENAI